MKPTKRSGPTPGPWAVGKTSDDTHGNTYAMVCSQAHEVDANLALIAAAPDLLSALKRLTEQLNELGQSDQYLSETLEPLIDEPLRAIAKARGDK